MSAAQLTKYYVNQAGSGLSTFQGRRFQHGSGFLSFLKSAGLPLLKYLGKQALSATHNILGDVIDGDPVKQAFKERSKDKLREIAGDISKRTGSFEQTGRGYNKKRKSKSKANKKKSTKRRKTKPKSARKNNKKLQLIKPSKVAAFF